MLQNFVSKDFSIFIQIIAPVPNVKLIGHTVSRILQVVKAKKPLKGDFRSNDLPW